MADQLPMTLRVYRKLSFAMMPLAPALIKQRLKQGKEDPARIGERRGISKDIRPHGPLVWIHGASVGEVLAAAGLIEKLRALNIRILLTSGTVTSAAVGAAKPAPEIFAHALALAGVGASGAVHVGDTLSEDVAGARACGIEPVLVRRGGEAPPGADPVTTIAALTEIAWPPARHR